MVSKYCPRCGYQMKKSSALRIGKYQLKKGFLITPENRVMPLTKTEDSILQLLFSNQDKLHSTRDLHNAIYGPDCTVNHTGSMRVLIMRLRKKLLKTTLTLVCQHGQGYYIYDSTQIERRCINATQ